MTLRTLSNSFTDLTFVMALKGQNNTVKATLQFTVIISLYGKTQFNRLEGTKFTLLRQ